MARRCIALLERRVSLSSTNRTDMTILAPCTHEKADTRLLLHVLVSSLLGHRRVVIRTNDTDVVVLAVSIVSTIPVEELWVTYGSGKQLQNLAAHTIAVTLGRERAFVLPMFHALTGCDTVLSLRVEARRQHGTCGVYFSSLHLHP